MLDLRIDTFLNLCETRSYTKTAEQLNITQPTVTQHIQYLENKYKTRLVSYSGRTLKITDKGEQLKRMALAMRANNKKIEQYMLSSDNRYKDINFGCTLTIGEYVMPDKINSYLNLNPDTNITMLVDNTKQLLQELDSGKIDFAIIEGYFEREKYGFHLMKKANYIGVCSSDHPFVDRVISFEDLITQRLILREEGSGTRDVFETILHEKNLNINNFLHRMEIGNFNAIKELVKKNLGITFVYQEVVEKELKEGSLKIIHLDNFNIFREFNLVYLKDDIFLDNYKEFWNYIGCEY